MAVDELTVADYVFGAASRAEHQRFHGVLAQPVVQLGAVQPVVVTIFPVAAEVPWRHPAVD
jgi:hypothetical protein